MCNKFFQYCSPSYVYDNVAGLDILFVFKIQKETEMWTDGKAHSRAF